MVCEKNNDVQHDFHKDPLKLIKKGDWLKVSITALQMSAAAAVTTRYNWQCQFAYNLCAASLRQACIHHESLSFSTSQALQSQYTTHHCIGCTQGIHYAMSGHVNCSCAVVSIYCRLKGQRWVLTMALVLLLPLPCWTCQTQPSCHPWSASSPLMRKQA